MKPIQVAIALALVAVVVLLSGSAYQVLEVEQVIITQFGQPRGETITEPGLHFRIPFIQKVNRFDKRWLEWDGDPNEMPTKEKTYIWVDAYARWRIKDPLKFFKSVKDERGAQSRLDDIINGETRNVIAAFELKEVVRLTNRLLPESAFQIEGTQAKPKLGDPDGAPAAPKTVDDQITQGRDKLTRSILSKAQEAMPEFGIELVDIRFQRVNYTKSVEDKVFERMISERKRIAELYRSEGKGDKARILGEMERELKQIESEAYRTSEELKGAADATATKIYADAHNRDPDLYRLLKSLESYEKTIDKNTTVILSTDSDFFKALSESR